MLPRDLKMVFPQVLREIVKNRVQEVGKVAETRPNFIQLGKDI